MIMSYIFVGATFPGLIKKMYFRGYPSIVQCSQYIYIYHVMTNILLKILFLIPWVDSIHEIHDNWYITTYNEFVVFISVYIEAHSTHFQRLKELESNMWFLLLWIILFCDLTTRNYKMCIINPPFFFCCSHFLVVVTIMRAFIV